MQIHLIKHHNYLEKPPTNQPTMPSSIAYKIEELEKELKQVNAKKEKLEKELIELKKDQQLTGSMQNQCVNRRRRRRNLPGELKVEIVDCLPVENAVHFLANVPNRLIIHHCAPRLRRILKMIDDQIAADYAHRLPALDSDGDIWLINGHHYTSEMDIFFRYGGAHCRRFFILRGASDGFVDYPADFFNDLIKFYYETKVPEKAVRDLNIYLPLTKPAPWPSALVQPQAGKMKLNVHKKFVNYILRNKHNPEIKFDLDIHFEEDDKIYRQMTKFVMDIDIE